MRHVPNSIAMLLVASPGQKNIQHRMLHAAAQNDWIECLNTCTNSLLQQQTSHRADMREVTCRCHSRQSRCRQQSRQSLRE